MTDSGYLGKHSLGHQRFNKNLSSTGEDYRKLTPLVLASALQRAGTVVCEPIHRFRLDAPADSLGPLLSVLARAGQAGRAVVRDLGEHGYEVAATDIAVSESDRFEGMLRADLTDYGEALRGADAVVHLANIPAPGLTTPPVTFNTNMTMNFNVFQAAVNLGLDRVVWASSETTLGLPLDVPPRYAPVDEDHFPLPSSTYALSKVATETIAGHFADWSGIPFVALRFSNIWRAEDYREFPEFWTNRGTASGICGDTSTNGTWLCPAGWPWKHPARRWPGIQPSSSRPRTR
jgi:hypothetical protein